MPGVAIYTRVSSDPLGASTSTSRQERQCRQFAELRGWDVVDVYEDVDLSAYRLGVRRPAFERLQADLPSLDGVLVWRLDRLVRRPADFEKFWGRCEELDVFLASATEPVDSSSEMGVAIVRILVTFAQLESHAKSERMLAKFEETARSGAPPQRDPAFGHGNSWREIVPHEAKLVVEAADRFLAGESLRAIAQSFDERGLRTRTGAQWKAQSLRALLSARRMVGDRAFHGEVVATNVCAPILDREVFEEIQQRFASVRRVSPMTRGLLTGWLVCGGCGGRLTAGSITNEGGRRYPSYGCGTPSGERNGRCVSISMRATDAWIRHQVLWRSQLAARWDRKLLRLVPAPVTTDVWEQLTRDERRTHIGRYLERVVVRVLEVRTGDWSEDRLVVTWRQQLVDAPPFQWVRDSFERETLAADDDRISAREAASILGISPWDLSALRVAGRLGAICNVGRRWAYSRSETMAFAAVLAAENAARPHRVYIRKPPDLLLDIARVYAEGVARRDHTASRAVWLWAHEHGFEEASPRAVAHWVDLARRQGYLTPSTRSGSPTGSLTRKARAELRARTQTFGSMS